MNGAAKLWIEALRSGNYKQSRGGLQETINEEETYCCLGVACKLFADNFPDAITVRKDNRYTLYNNRSGGLPKVVLNWLGVSTRGGNYGDTSLIRMNDEEGKSFSEIAAIIESEPEGLFSN